jgi:hypothetical protein
MQPLTPALVLTSFGPSWQLSILTEASNSTATENLPTSNNRPTAVGQRMDELILKATGTP